MKESKASWKVVITFSVAGLFALIAIACFWFFVSNAVGEVDRDKRKSSGVTLASDSERIARDVFVAYDKAQYPRLAEKVGERWGELQPLRESAAHAALKEPGCGKVTTAEISVDRSTRETIRAFVYCDDSMDRIDYTDAELSTDPRVRAAAALLAREAAESRERDELWSIHMQDRVREQLKDPDSAGFRNVRTHHGGGVPVVCGEVNSRNSFGGMSGYQRFVAAGSVIALDEQVDGGVGDVWNRFCRD